MTKNLQKKDFSPPPLPDPTPNLFWGRSPLHPQNAATIVTRMGGAQKFS